VDYDYDFSRGVLHSISGGVVVVVDAVVVVVEINPRPETRDPRPEEPAEDQGAVRFTLAGVLACGIAHYTWPFFRYVAASPGLRDATPPVDRGLWITMLPLDLQVEFEVEIEAGAGADIPIPPLTDDRLGH
jgi:hypothetical protein